MIGEFIVDVLFTGIVESLPKFIGTSVRWCFYLGKKSYTTVFKEDGNKRVGFVVICIIILLIIVLNN